MSLGMETYLTVGGRSLSTKWIALLAMISTAILLISMNMEIGIYDESIIMQGAVEVGLGNIPHRDFFFTYGPMQLWIISALSYIFGEGLIVARLYDVAVRGAIILVCGLIARRLGLRSSLVVGVMLIETALIFASGFHLYPVFPCLLCALSGTLLLADDRPGVDIGTGRLVAAGMLTGLTAWFRYDIGFFVLAAHLASLCLFCLDARQSFRLWAGKVTAYGIGVSLVFLPIAWSAWAVGAVPGFIHDIVSFPPGNYARMRALPWPVPGFSIYSLLPLISYVPFVAAALGVAWLVGTRAGSREKKPLDAATKLGAALLILVPFFILKGVVRVSFIHSILALVPTMLLIVFLSTRKEVAATSAPSRAVLALGSLLILLNAASVFRAEAQNGFQSLLPARLAGHAPAAMRGAPCATLPPLGPGIVDRDTYHAACYIASHSGPGEEIYVGAGRHDKLFLNNVALYYLSGRRPATHWYHLEPGLQTQPEIQQEIIEDLIKNNVRLIAIDTRFDDVKEPNDSATSSGARLLDQFIESHYVREALFGDIAILTRRQPGF